MIIKITENVNVENSGLFLYPEYDLGSFPKYNHFLFWSGPTHIKTFQEDVLVLQ